jgi:AraC-like DNA-binding protein
MMSKRLFLRLDEDEVHGPEVSAPASTMRALPVCAELRPYLAHVLSYRESFAEGEPVLEHVLPDGAVRLVLHLGDAPTVGGRTAGRVLAVGASAAPVVVQLHGQVRGLSVTLRPGATLALLGVPAHELGDGAVPLDALWPREEAELLQQLADTRDDRGSAEVLQTALLRAALLRAASLQRRQSGDAAAGRAARSAVALIAASQGQRTLCEVAASLGVGERRLQQLFRAQVGLSPRAYGRLARLHGCLRALRSQLQPRWADVAVRSGFYDQAHLVNEFRALCGMTPGEFLGLRGRTDATASAPL